MMCTSLPQEPLSELDRLQKYGASYKLNAPVRTIRVRLLATVFDLPARASIFNHIQWNGAFGCMDCKDPGKRVGSAYVWPFAFSASEKSSEWYSDVYNYIKVQSICLLFDGYFYHVCVHFSNIQPLDQSWA